LEHSTGFAYEFREESERALLIGITQEQPAAQVLTDQPIARFARPEEIAQAVLYLASDAESSYVTGHALQIDGGQWAGATAGLRR